MMTEKATPTQAARPVRRALGWVLAYLALAVGRQVFHDLRSMRRWRTL
jgi:hypothetical protein